MLTLITSGVFPKYSLTLVKLLSTDCFPKQLPLNTWSGFISICLDEQRYADLPQLVEKGLLEAGLLGTHIFDVRWSVWIKPKSNCTLRLSLFIFFILSNIFESTYKFRFVQIFEKLLPPMALINPLLKDGLSLNDSLGVQVVILILDCVFASSWSLLLGVAIYLLPFIFLFNLIFFSELV